MKAAHVQKIPQIAMEYVLKPIAIAGFFVIVALLWTFPLQHIIAYPFVFLFLAQSWVAPGLGASAQDFLPF
jgi:hypothetical protein